MNQISTKFVIFTLFGILIAISSGCGQDKSTEDQWCASDFNGGKSTLTLFLDTDGVQVVRGEFVMTDPGMDPVVDGDMIYIFDIHQANLGDDITFAARMNGTDKKTYLLQFPSAFPPTGHAIKGILTEQDNPAATTNIELYFRDDRERRKDNRTRHKQLPNQTTTPD